MWGEHGPMWKIHHFAGWFSQQSSIDRFVPSNPLVKSSFCHGKMTMKTGWVYPSFCRRLICHKLLVIPWYQGDSSTPIVQIQFFQVTILQWKIPRLVRWFPHFLWGISQLAIFDLPEGIHDMSILFPVYLNVFTMFFLIVGYTPVIWRFPRIGVPQIIYVNVIVHYKPSILGYPHLWKPPYIHDLDSDFPLYPLVI